MHPFGALSLAAEPFQLRPHGSLQNDPAPILDRVPTFIMGKVNGKFKNLRARSTSTASILSNRQSR